MLCYEAAPLKKVVLNILCLVAMLSKTLFGFLSKKHNSFVLQVVCQWQVKGVFGIIPQTSYHSI